MKKILHGFYIGNDGKNRKGKNIRESSFFIGE
jgi:hypothetical protein